MKNVNENQVELLNEVLLNIYSNFIPNKVMTIRPRQAHWITQAVKSFLRKNNRAYNSFVRNGRPGDKLEGIQAMISEGARLIEEAKRNYFLEAGKTLASPATSSKTYWTLINTVLNKVKIPMIPPLLENGLFVTDLTEKAQIFNDYFILQCTTIDTGSEIAQNTRVTATLISDFVISEQKILNIIRSFNRNKAHGLDEISLMMIKLSDLSLVLALKIIFTNCLRRGLFPEIWKLKRCGVSGQLLSLFQSFLKDRKQRTVFSGQSSGWGDISAGVPQGSILGPLFFLVYINDLAVGLKCNVKLIADDTSLFTVVKDSNTAASDMNHDLDLIGQWAHTWRMSFNPDPQKQAVELKFSKKKIEIDHPVILFNNLPVKKVDEHKHLGVILDSKLSFSAHIKSAISKTRKGIGLLKYLSKYLPRHTLIEIYKLYVRPHLDYGNVIYHIPAKVCDFSGNIVLPNLMQRLESVQYSAALAVTGTWRGTSREKLYADLGLESLSSQRWSRRLTLFYKFVNNLSPDYTGDAIPPFHQSQYCLRDQRYWEIKGKN